MRQNEAKKKKNELKEILKSTNSSTNFLKKINSDSAASSIDLR